MAVTERGTVYLPKLNQYGLISLIYILFFQYRMVWKYLILSIGGIF